MKKMLAAAVAIALAAPAWAQQPAAAPRTVASVDNLKVNQLIVYGDQACPPSTEEEIIVCYKAKDSPYRVPEALRTDDGPASNSWANRATELQYVGRTGIGSCSPTGPGGATGCLLQFINQARAERRGTDPVNWNALIEQARQERLGRIDAEAEAIEREEGAPR